jgi:PadR family transcriptional regulator, regulatory protein PadR
LTSILPREEKISPVQMWLLFVLSDGPDYGYNLIQRLDRMFAGYWKPKAGTIYPALDKLASEGLVSRSHEHREEGLDRRNYTITPQGEEALRKGMGRWSQVMEHVELYGERHRALRRMKKEMPRGELADALIRFGELLKGPSFNVSNVLPALESMEVEVPENVVFKFLYAPEGDGMEIEIELEWPNSNKLT